MKQINATLYVVCLGIVSILLAHPLYNQFETDNSKTTDAICISIIAFCLWYTITVFYTRLFHIINAMGVLNYNIVVLQNLIGGSKAPIKIPKDKT